MNFSTIQKKKIGLPLSVLENLNELSTNDQMIKSLSRLDVAVQVNVHSVVSRLYGPTNDYLVTKDISHIDANGRPD